MNLFYNFFNVQSVKRAAGGWDVQSYALPVIMVDCVIGKTAPVFVHRDTWEISVRMVRFNI